MPETTPSVVLLIPLTQIIPSAHQARKTFNNDSIQGLAESMKQEGLLNSIVVRQMAEGKGEKEETVSPEQSSDSPSPSPLSPRYELISGERRFRAAKLLGWEAIEAKVITTISEGEAAAKGLIENIQREDLNPIEEAQGFAELNLLDPVYWTQEQIASVSGKTQTYISRSLALLSLPEAIRESMRRRILSRNHGVELCRLPTPELQTKVSLQIPERLTVLETRRFIDSILDRKNNPKRIIKRSENKTGDPLAQIWLQAKTFLKPGEPNPEVHFEGTQWVLEIPNTFKNPDSDLADYFEHLAGALRKAHKQESRLPALLPMKSEKKTRSAPHSKNW